MKKGAPARATLEPSYANELVVEGPVRRIRDELYGDAGYDAIWRLPNSGFVIRLDGKIIFLDAIFTSPHPVYEAERRKIAETGRLHDAALELKYHDRWENLFKEVHAPPLAADEVERADLVLITHEHEDHFEIDGLKRIGRLGPTFIAPESCHEALGRVGLPDDSIVEARYGERHDLGVFTVTVVPASHSPGACGYLIETRHGNIYHPGDGRFDHADKAANLSLDVEYLLLPINDTNMGVGFAALLAHLLQPRVVIPCHYGYTYPPVRWMGGHPAELVTALAARNYKMPSTDIMILSPGGKLVLV